MASTVCMRSRPETLRAPAPPQSAPWPAAIGALEALWRHDVNSADVAGSPTLRNGGAMKKDVLTALLIFFVLMLPAQLGATAIVIVRTDSSVFIGADSLRIINGTERVLVCKIARFGEVYTLAAGLVAYDLTAFDLRTFVERAARGAGSLASKMSALDEQVVRPLTLMAERLRRDDPEFTTRYLKRYFVQVAFVGIENGQPVITQRRYMPKLDVKGELDMSVFGCPSNECSAVFDMFMLGETTAMRGHKNARKGSDVQAVIHELINLQIQATPERVGPPINILRIAKDGARWLEGGEICGSL